MTLSHIKNEISFEHTSIDSQNQINIAISNFDQIIRKYVLYHIGFFILGFSQIILFFYYFNILSQMALISIALSGFLLTVFLYFILRTYWQTIKAQQILKIKIDFVDEMKLLLGYQEDLPEYHIAMANTLCRLSENMIGKEYTYYLPPAWLTFSTNFFEKLSFWGHWKDCHQLKEIALSAAVEEQIKHVKCEPTNPDAHTSLANTYILLTGLYALSHCQEEDGGLLGPSKNEREEMKQKFRIAAERAIEELKILSNFAPNDPWIHEQLAYSYRDLQMPAEEIQEYELILRLMPNNAEIIYKLGVLYFEQGKNSLGLHLYEQLKHTHYKKAHSLIAHYGAYSQLY